MQLRENQKEPARIAIDYFSSKKDHPAIIVAPTAFGKSVLISYVANKINDKILVIQPSKELLEQNYNKLLLLGGEAKIFSASMGVKEIGNITYSTIGSIYKIGDKFKELGITKIIIDECDRFARSPDGMLRKFIKDAKITHVLGLSATPLKLQTASGMTQLRSGATMRGNYGIKYSILKMLTTRSKSGILFKNIIHITQIQDMVKLGFWSKLIYHSVDFDTSMLQFNSTGAEYTDSSIKVAFKSNNIHGRIIEAINTYSDRKSILVAVPGVEEARDLARITPNSKAVWGDMDKKERAKAIEEFKNGVIRVIFQVNVLSVGFDHPELDMIISARPTSSLSWWYQFVGRATRIHPNKKDAIVLDLVGNLNTFGKVEEFRYAYGDNKWNLFGEDNILLTETPLNILGINKYNVDNYYFGNEGVDFSKIKAKKLDAIDELIESTRKDQAGSYVLNFGKHSGRKISEVPVYYLQWITKEFKWSEGNKDLKEAVTNYLELCKI
jgi:DNA repair protein RadD